MRTLVAAGGQSNLSSILSDSTSLPVIQSSSFWLWCQCRTVAVFTLQAGRLAGSTLAFWMNPYIYSRMIPTSHADTDSSATRTDIIFPSVVSFYRF